MSGYSVNQCVGPRAPITPAGRIARSLFSPGGVIAGVMPEESAVLSDYITEVHS